MPDNLVIKAQNTWSKLILQKKKKKAPKGTSIIFEFSYQIEKGSIAIVPHFKREIFVMAFFNENDEVFVRMNFLLLNVQIFLLFFIY